MFSRSIIRSDRRTIKGIDKHEGKYMQTHDADAPVRNKNIKYDRM